MTPGAFGRPGGFIDRIDIDSKVEPQKQLDVTIMATAGDFPVNPNGYLFTFAPRQTGDSRKFDGANLKQSLKLFVLPASDPSVLGPTAEEKRIAEQIRQYLYENFGVPGYKTSWYDSIGDVNVIGNVVTAKTPLSAGPESDARASQVCQALSGFVYANPNKNLGLRSVKVLAKDGTALIVRSDVSDPCRVRR